MIAGTYLVSIGGIKSIVKEANKYMISCPCTDCDLRHLGCHSYCKAYIAYKQKCTEIKKLRHKETNKFSMNWTKKGQPTNLNKFRKEK